MLPTLRINNFIVSYVLGVKIVITEKSIAALLSMEKDGGRRIYNINPRAKYISQEINPTIFKQNAEGNPSKNKELLQNLRIWLKIILGTIHHRPASNSSDYINTDQKCMLYCIHKGLKLFLPALLFKYLRDSVRDTRNHMKPRTYIPLGRLILDVLIESGLVDHLVKLRLMEDMAIDTGKPLNAKNMKSMGILDQVKFRPTLDTSWDALIDQRKIPHGLYLFSREEPRDVILFYLQGLKDEGVDISDFHLSDLPDKAPNFMRHKRGPSEKTSQAKKAKLVESSGSRPPAPLHEPSGKSVSPAPSTQTQSIASSIPKPTPIYTPSETPSTTRTSQPLQKFNLATTTLPLSEAERLNETTSSSSSSESPPYFTISSYTEPFDPSSPTLAQLQTQNLASQQPQQSPPEPEVTSPPIEQPNLTPSDVQPSDPSTSDIPPPNTSAEPQTLNLSPPTSPPLPSEPQNSLPTLEEAIMLFAGASVDKSLSKQVRNDFIRDTEVRLQERLAREAEEQARKEAEEKARQEEIQRVKEAEAKALAGAAAAKAEAKAAAEAEVKAAAEAEARRTEEQNALTQGESFTFVPLVLKTLEELQKEQKEVRARLDQQDTVNANIQNLLTQLLQRMPPPPNP
ncbi:hypothetical protein KIW84_074997 [Lathyrus oleraceus]|uniref:Uncharacterized protein n=1 Tax=Pisum sativum TaxID=3888 RepID=A0A9D5A0K9_PEA|nr:hypothetical protein KIW84_074997 [Pisum sativum]